MSSRGPFEYLQHKQEKLGVKMSIWFPTIKSWEFPWITCVQVKCHISLKVLDKGYNFAWDLTLIRGFHKKFWSSKVTGVLILGISRFPTCEFREKWHLDVAPWIFIDNSIRAKVMDSPKFGPWWILWVCVCPWLVRASKVLQLCINQLVVWFV
jgi:hypothetical protein